jgi:hypothetical protein
VMPQIVLSQGIVKAAYKYTVSFHTTMTQPFNFTLPPLLIKFGCIWTKRLIVSAIIVERILNPTYSWTSTAVALSFIFEKAISGLWTIALSDLNWTTLDAMGFVEQNLGKSLNLTLRTTTECNKGKASTLSSVLVPHYCHINNSPKLLEVALNIIL